MNEEHKDCILVVEDDADTLRALLRLLALNGYPSYGARTYHDALEVFAQEQCPILLADISLTDGSGLDLMRKLKPLGVRGIAVTGDPAYDNPRASLAAGFDAHLLKPVRFSELLKTIERLSRPIASRT